jgi:hypothetical protein
MRIEPHESQTGGVEKDCVHPVVESFQNYPFENLIDSTEEAKRTKVWRDTLK